MITTLNVLNELGEKCYRYVNISENFVHTNLLQKLALSIIILVIYPYGGLYIFSFS